MAQKLVIVALFWWPSDGPCVPKWDQMAMDFQCVLFKMHFV
jgi:hypothetical protein